MRSDTLSLLVSAALLSPPASAAYCVLATGAGNYYTASVPSDCGAGWLYYSGIPDCGGPDGLPVFVIQDGAVRCRTEAELLEVARAACRVQALADWRALRDSAWLPDDLTAMGLSGLPESDREAAAADSVLLLRVRSALGITGAGAIDGWPADALATCGNPDPAVAPARAALYDWSALLSAAEAETGKTRSARLAAAVAGVQQ